MSPDVTDHRSALNGGRLRHFLRIDRGGRKPWHRLEAQPAGNRRLVEFLRIARGRMA